MRPAHLTPLLAAIALGRGACAPTPAAERVFPAGRYAYEASWRPPGATALVRRAGTLVLDAVTADSLVGRWEVAGYLPEFPHNDFTVVSYFVTAHAVEGSDTLVVSHYLRRDARTGAVDCRLGVATRTGGYRDEGTCTVVPAR